MNNSGAVWKSLRHLGVIDGPMCKADGAKMILHTFYGHFFHHFQ